MTDTTTATIVATSRTIPGKRPSFDVEDRITVRLDPNLAIELGDFILNNGTPNKALWALGHKLKAVENQFLNTDEE